MRAERDVTMSVARMRTENVADFIAVNRLQPEFAEFVRQPFAAGAFAKGRRGNAREFQLPLRELWFLSAKPGKGRAYLRQRAEMDDFLLHARKQLGDFGVGSRHGWFLVVSRWSLVLGLW